MKGLLKASGDGNRFVELIAFLRLGSLSGWDLNTHLTEIRGKISVGRVFQAEA